MCLDFMKRNGIVNSRKSSRETLGKEERKTNKKLNTILQYVSSIDELQITSFHEDTE